MGSLRDFAASMSSDLMLPFFRTTLEDLVYDILNEREIPNRTQFAEVRDLVNGLRGPVSSATSSLKKLESRLSAIEAQVEQQEKMLKKLSADTAKPKKPKKKAKKA